MTQTYSALREYRKRIAAMLDDPECTGDLLSLGISLLDFAVLRVSRDEKKFEFYARRSWGDRNYRTRSVLKSDIRRYDALKDADTCSPARECGAPMVRRKGPCGQSAGRRALLTDADTGRKQWIAACSRHRDWFEARVRSNRAEIEVSNPERPAANAGGVLARHIPEIDWVAVWKDLDPAWTPPPERKPEEVPLKPRLTLVLGGA
ncbi:hypothetical protein ACFJIY_07575 [Pimelobacter simplex]|uniref:hypothetical protein n=1 Tax=Nocardioides simplex TaxID=2045 RepID=UPI0036717EBB